ncbi:MAG: aminotransferase class III-fold pyridoxal phosphate-dependent enzyme [Roseovarius sp.]|nr:aminotransferase class III-fold pyridoxal phosphate-dependent enzyme [Roseovarius sp.]
MKKESGRLPGAFGGETGALPRISHAKGSHMWDMNGNCYVDGSGGPALYCIGHADARVNQAVSGQMEKIAHAYRLYFNTEALEELTRIISGKMGADLEEMLFVSSGTEAVESAMKVALQYHYDRGEPQRVKFIARERSWHGNALMATSLSGFKARRQPFEGALFDVGRVGAANAYRPPEGVGGNALVEHLENELRNEMERLGSENVAAFVFEPVVGAAGGAVPAPDGYAKAMTDLCHAHGILVISDEVMCGSGRSGVWRASEEDGIVPDIVAVAKGLAGGYLPLGAAVYTKRVGDAIRAGHGALVSGQTFNGHTACLAAGVAVQNIIEEERLVERVAERAPKWMRELRERLDRFDEVGDVRGRGYLVGIELVADRDEKKPFEPEFAVAGKIGAEAMKRGLICYPSSGNVDGVSGDQIILAPAYNATDEVLEEIAAKMEATIGNVLADIRN